MNDLILRDSGTLTISDSDRIRIAAAWVPILVEIIRGRGAGVVSGSTIGA